jgi:1-acyl-sn-glycerol-3-phosphate acyltransferase
MAERSLTQRIGYAAVRTFARFTGVVVFRIRCRGRQNIPGSGPLIVCANHQSFLDPALIGCCFDRRLNYLGRKSLFRFAPVRLFLSFLDAIPLDRDGLGLAGLRESIRRIKNGEGVLLFPEGTRTHDGSVLPLQPGFCVLARRGNVTMLPVGIDGAFDAWPRTANLPTASRIHVCIGEPLSPEEIRELDDESLVAEVERRIRDCHQQAKVGRSR